MAPGTQGELDVAKQVALFCSSSAPQLTVDEVMAEAAQLVTEDNPIDSAPPSRSLSAHGLDDLPAFKQYVRFTPGLDVLAAGAGERQLRHEGVVCLV